MPKHHLELRARAALRAVAWTALILATAWLIAAWLRRWDRHILSVEDWRVRVFLSLAGAAVAAAVARWLVYAARVFPRAALAGLAAWGVSSVCFALLVWTSLKVHPALWRVWWVSLIGALAAALWTALRLPATGRRGPVERAAAGCLAALAVLLAGLAFRVDILAAPGTAVIALALLLLAVVSMGAVVARVRFARARPPRPVSHWKRRGWVVTGQAALVGVAFYAGRVTQPAPSPFDKGASPLAAMTPAEIEEQVTADLRRLRALDEALHDLRASAAELHGRVNAARGRDGRQYFTPAEAEQMRPVFIGYLATRDALLRMVATYCGFEHVRDPALRARCFLVGFGAGSLLYANSLRVVALGDDPVVRRHLNEAEPAWNLPAGRFDEIHHALASDRTVDIFQEMAAYYSAHKDQWTRQAVLPATELTWLTGEVDAAIAEVRLLDIGDRDRARRDLLLARVKSDAYDPLYAMQSAVSTWIGDTRLVARPSFISPGQIKSIQHRLRPGDILLERRNWFASNAFLPGFWPHAALYVGTPEDLQRLGLIRMEQGRWMADDPVVAAKLEAYLAHGHEGEPNTVIEAVSEGVVFNTHAHSMAADYVAVLRPRRLSDAERALAIRRAFAHAGKPYDFEFDFATADKLVCTELVYQCYGDLLNFDCDPARPGEQLPQIMGRPALPALEFCHKFSREHGSPERELDLVLFLDAVPAQRTARESDEAAFRESASRPRGFNE